MSGAGFIQGVLAGATRARRRLSIQEVLEAGLPAVYQQYGDRLIYLDGRILDVSDPAAPAEVVVISPDSPDAARQVGLEFGWRHVSGCLCANCAMQPGKEGPTASVGLPRRQREEALAS